jgi:hypothetical protein
VVLCSLRALPCFPCHQILLHFRGSERKTIFALFPVPAQAADFRLLAADSVLIAETVSDGEMPAM